MKKLLPLILMVLVLFGCSSSKPSDGSKTNPGSDTTDEFTYTAGEVTLKMNGEIDEDTLKKIGDYDYYEAKSCAFEGIDKTFTYPSIVVQTYPTDDKDYVSSVALKDDTVETAEGIYIGSSKDEVIKAYGDDYVESNGNLTYTKGKSQLEFIFSGDTVTSITYVAITPASA